MMTCSLRYQYGRCKEKFLMWLAWHMPHQLVMWCGIRMMAHASMGVYRAQDVTTVTCADVLKRWEDK